MPFGVLFRQSTGGVVKNVPHENFMQFLGNDLMFLNPTFRDLQCLAVCLKLAFFYKQHLFTYIES